MDIRDDGGYELTFGRPGGMIFGLGEILPAEDGTPMKLQYNGTRRGIWNTHRPPANLAIPFFIDTSGYALFVDNTWKAEFDLGSSGHVRYSATGGPLRFYVIAADNVLSALDSFTALTGRAPIPPRWALGFMQSKYGYKTEAEYRSLMKEFRSRGIPCDTLVFDLDWFGPGGMGNLWWNRDNFSGYEKLMADMEAGGFHAIAISEPYINVSSTNYMEARSKKALARDANGQPMVFKLWGRPSSIMDYTSGKARAWYAAKIRKIKESGVDAWWTDLNEPDIEPDDTVYRMGGPAAVHNGLAFLMNKAIFDMYSENYPDERCMIMSRSGFAGMQRFGAGVWSGDVTASWEHLRDQVPVALNAGMSALANWNSDTGGFRGHPSPELYTRWIQQSAFTPMMRAHGDHKDREPWAFGEQAERICKKYIELRMRLIPYLYTLYYERYTTGAPLMRPTFAHYPDADPGIATQFLLGRDMLVAPVTEESAVSKNVYLPDGKWFDFDSGDAFSGAREISVPVDLDKTPVFIRAGAILPLGPVIRYTGEKTGAPLTIHYYPSDEPSVFNLYEDDGVSRAYERGGFAITTITGSSGDGAARLEIKAPEGSYEGMPGSRAFEIFIHSGRPGAAEVEGAAIIESGYSERLKAVRVLTGDSGGGVIANFRF